MPYNTYPCDHLEVTADASANFPTVDWRNDVVLSVPTLLFPRDGSTICLDNASTTTANIALEWSTVAGATFYVLQLCENNSFKGPTLRSVKVTAPDTSYNLLKDIDIRLGESVYWRVMALNGVGGTSRISEARQVSYECNNAQEFQNVNEGRAQSFDVNIKILGNDWMYCCDKAAYPIEMSYTSHDQEDREILRISEVVYSIESDPTHRAGAVTVEPFSNTDASGAIVETCGEESQIFRIKVEALFDDLITGDQFKATAYKEVYMDCKVPVGDKPWAGGNAYRKFKVDRLAYGFEEFKDPDWGDLDSSKRLDNTADKFVIARGPVYKIFEGERCDDFCVKCGEDRGPLVIELLETGQVITLTYEEPCSWSGEKTTQTPSTLDLYNDCDAGQEVSQTVNVTCENGAATVMLEECCTSCPAQTACCEYQISNTLEADIFVEGFGSFSATLEWNPETQAWAWATEDGGKQLFLYCTGGVYDPENSGWGLVYYEFCPATSDLDDRVVWTESNNELTVTCESSGAFTLASTTKNIRWDREECTIDPNTAGVQVDITGPAISCVESNCNVVTYTDDGRTCLPWEESMRGAGYCIDFRLSRLDGDNCYDCSTVFGDLYEKDVIYEAQVKIPIGVGLVYNDGVLEVDLDDITYSTTTIDPLAYSTAYPLTVYPSCYGYCKFVWSGSLYSWSEDINACGVNPTTTTTPPPPATTTTPDPCAEPTTTTTSTSSTTQAPTECDCAPPQFCGLVDGECTYTYCVENPPLEKDCGPTTSTTTCDCATTTTTTGDPSDPCGGCTWFLHPCLGLRKVEDRCAPFGCEPCPEPDVNGADLCTYFETNCGDPDGGDGGGGGPGKECRGTCVWTEFLGELVLCEAYCPPQSQSPNCGCPDPPSVTPDPESCERYHMPCATSDPDPDPGTTSTTTQDEPCWDCYNTSTTTEEPDECEAQCLWQAAEQGPTGIWYWDIISNPCPQRCPCVYPPQVPREDGECTETVSTDCGTGTETTTTVDPSSTSTAPRCDCLYECKFFYEGGYFWVLVDDNCDDPGCSGGCETGVIVDALFCNAANEGRFKSVECGGSLTTAVFP